MPLYEYRCQACGQRFEVIQKFSEVTEVCRLCGKGPVERLQSAPGFQFKGTGWYITDYAQKGKPGGEASPGKSDSTDSSKKSDSGSGETSTKTETTPASPPTAPASKG